MSPKNESNDLPRCDECGAEITEIHAEITPFCIECLTEAGEAPIEDVVDYLERRGH